MANTKTTRAATSHLAPFGVRMQPELKERLEQAAQAAGRSMNAEIVRRLELSFNFIGDAKVEQTSPTPQPIGGDLTWYITTEIKALAEAQSIPFDEMLAKIFVAGLHPHAPQVLYAPIFPGATSRDMRAMLEASDAIAKPDATIISEMIQRAPWVPSWLAERLKSQGLENVSPDPSAARGDVETSAIAVAVTSEPPTAGSEPPQRRVRVRKEPKP